MRKLAAMLLLTLVAVPAALAEPEVVRFTPDCEFTVTFPGKISTKLDRSTGKYPQAWMHVRDIEFLAKHHEISAICRPIDPRGREFELLMFYRNMEKEARRVQIARPQIAVKQDRKHHIVLGEWRGRTRDNAQRPVTVEGRYVLGRRSKLLMMVATPGTDPESGTRVTGFFRSLRRK